VNTGIKVVLMIVAGALLTVTGLAQEREVVINEVAWGGSREDPTGEWIELFNSTDHAISLEGWCLVSSDGSPDILLRGTIPSSGFYLLERDDDGAVPSIDADLIYCGALRDGGEALRLLDPTERIIDTANQEEDRWPAGTNGLGFPAWCSMERIDPTGPDIPVNWATHQPTFSEDGEEDAICGTPKSAFNLSPIAEFSVSPMLAHPGEPFFFDASASFDPNGEITSFVWDFGDETTGKGQKTSHIYVKSGKYMVSLVVTDDAGAVSQPTCEVPVIVNYQPRVDFSVRSLSLNRVLQSLDAIEFIDESYDPDGEIVAWCWGFGDSEFGEGHTALHTYRHSGEYIIALTVIDDNGETASQTQSLRIENRLPVARFDFAPKIPNEGEQVTFDASVSYDEDGAVVRYEWDFNTDGLIDICTEQPTVSYTFPKGGEFEVSLRVIDAEGATSYPFSTMIDVNWKPIAAFRATSFSLNELEEVSFTDCSRDPGGAIEMWRWDFGDGTSSDLPSPCHIYQTDGTYTVTLTVTDKNGVQDQMSAKIAVKNLSPSAKFTANGKEDELEVLTRDLVTFDASKSEDRSPEGKIVRYEWDLNGDGTYEECTTSPTLTHSYLDDGNYKVRLRVVDDDGATARSSLIIKVKNRPPNAAFDWTPRLLDDSSEAVFFDRSTDVDGVVIGWHWEFGDGETATNQPASHRFLDDGVYTVTLVVRDDDGSASPLLSKGITVGNASPLAAFRISTSSPRVGEAVHFIDRSCDPSPTGAIIHVAWDFGDGTSCPGLPGCCGDGDIHSPTHIYDVPGLYTVTLIVIDEEGALSNISRTLRVKE